MNQPDDATDPIATTLDEELVLYYYRDGLVAERIAAIAATLAASPELRARYGELCAVLEAARAVTAPEPAAGLEQRTWDRLQERLATARDAAPRRAQTAAPSSTHRRRRRFPWAMAAALAAALGLGVVIGSALLDPASQPLATAPEAQPASTAPLPSAIVDRDPLLAARLLDAYVADHLRASQGLLLTALNEPQGPLAGSGDQLAAALVDSNRLYAAAAARAGNARLAELLRQLEPLLIELANPPASDGIEVRKGLREYLRDSDLLFRLRATEARLDPRSGRSA